MDTDCPCFVSMGWLVPRFIVCFLFLFFVGLKTLSIRQVLNKYIETMKINFCDLWKTAGVTTGT